MKNRSIRLMEIGGISGREWMERYSVVRKCMVIPYMNPRSIRIIEFGVEDRFRIEFSSFFICFIANSLSIMSAPSDTSGGPFRSV